LGSLFIQVHSKPQDGIYYVERQDLQERWFRFSMIPNTVIMPQVKFGVKFV